MSMLRPAVNQLIKPEDSTYSLIVGIARRAREITNDAFENKIVLEEKPVKTAVEEFYNGKFKIYTDAGEGHHTEISKN